MVNRLSFYDLVRSQLELMEKSDYCKKIWKEHKKDPFETEPNHFLVFDECLQKLYELVQQAKQSLEL